MKKLKRIMRILLVGLIVVGLLIGYIGATTGANFTDGEQSTDNTLRAWISSLWVQTTQREFEAGVLTNVATTSSPGDGNVILAEVSWGSYSSELLINPDAETGDTTGWTAVGTYTANFVAGTECHNCPSGGAPAGPHIGTYSFMWNAPTASDDWAYQEIDLYSNGFEERVNAGKAQLKAGGYLVCGECDPDWDRIQLKILLYDSGHSLIETSFDSGQLFQICSWTWYGITDYNLPTNARYVRVEFQTIEPPSWGAGKADDFTAKVRVKEYYPSGTIASQVLDTGAAGTTWDELSWNETLESGTDITFEVRASDTVFLKDAATPDWIDLGLANSPITSGLPSGRYMQWQATLSTTDTSKTPILHDVTITYY